MDREQKIWAGLKDHYEEALEKFQKSDNFRPNESLKEKIFRKFRNLFD